MKLKNLHIIYILIGAMSLFACSEDHLAEEQPVECCVRMDWSNGRGGGTRTLSSLLGAGGAPLEISKDDYPKKIEVTCNDKDFELTFETPSSLEECNDHTGFYHGYTTDYPLKDIEVKKALTNDAVSAKASIDDEQDKLYCKTADVELDNVHLKLTLQHSNALLRFLFKVDPKYDKIRFIKVKNVLLKKSETQINVKMKENGLILNTDGFNCASYSYIDPEDIGINTPLQISCTYDIYDKDAKFDGSMDDNTLALHLTRKDVTATNNLTLNNILHNDNPVKQIQAGYYYDLNVTINPDYLYVLSEHDNKQHITIE